jgi:PEGA domain
MRGSLIASAVLAFCVSGCSTIVEGKSQLLSINTTPPGATCVLTRNGETIGSVTPTPGNINVEKTKHDITVTCDKDGYEQTTLINKSGSAGATFGNIILGGGIGWAIDSATGSDNKYDTPVTVTLNKK